MARVFPVPAYRNVLEQAIAPLTARSREIPLYAARGVPVSQAYVLADEDTCDGDIDEIHALYATGANASEGIVTTRAILAAILSSLRDSTSVKYGSDGVDHIFAHAVTRGISRSTLGAADGCDAVARVIALAGCVGGFGSPGACASALSSMSVSSVVAPCGSPSMNYVMAADAIRTRCSSAKASRFHASLRGDNAAIDPDDAAVACRVAGGPIAESLGMRHVYVAGGHLIIAVGRAACVLSPLHRANLAACLYSWGMWGITAACAASDAGLVASQNAQAYLRNVIAANMATPLCQIARYLKCEYAIIVNRAQSGADEALFEAAEAGLAAESAACAPPALAESFADVMGHSEDSINHATVWNVLPPADIDTRAMVESFIAKTSAPRVCDDEAWRDFIGYAGMVITAHYIASHKDAVITWASGAVADPPWAEACRSGTATYSEAGDYDHMVDQFDWVNTLESWHHDAQDVTHVWADDVATTDNELTYALAHAPLLSGTWTPAQVRTAWQNGAVPGKRNLVMAGKSENTKYGGKCRETMSADDVTREVLSEIDQNMSTVGAYVQGVAMRAGRHATECMINSVLHHGTASRTLISLDVSGWSPNMPRAWELAFIDTLMSMFKIPAGQRASCVFRDLTVWVRKGGVDMHFPMIDGSVQGFFGTADTIMHSLIAQWAFRNAKRDRIFGPRGKIAKCALIDDILCAVDATGATPAAAVDRFVHEYARLGLTVDPVKTLAAPNIGTFLNRVYAGAGEIETWHKIASRADREWDRPVVGLAAEIATIYASFAGAVDRGANILGMYYLAAWRSVLRVRAVTTTNWVPTDALIACIWYGPGTLGGLGVPVASDWVATTAHSPIAKGLAALVTIRDAANGGSHAHIARIDSALGAFVGADIADRGTAAIAADPAAVRTVNANDAIAGVKAAIRRAIHSRREYQGNEYAALATLVADDDSLAAWADVISCGAYPAELLSALWSSTAFAVADSIMDRFTSCQTLLKLVKRRTLNACLARVLRSDRAQVERVLASAAPAVGSAHDINASLVLRESIAHRIAGVVPTATCDIVRQTPGVTHSPIAVYIPALERPHSYTAGKTVVRSGRSATVRVETMAIAIARNPVLSAFKRLAVSCAVAAACGADGSAARALVAASWGLPRRAITVAGVSAANPLRALASFSTPEHAVRAAPNAVSRVAVDLSHGIRAMDSVHKAFDWMDVRTFLLAASAVDIDAGMCAAMRAGGHGEVVRRYAIMAGAAVVRDITCRPHAAATVRARAVAGASVFDAMVFDGAIAGVDEGEVAVDGVGVVAIRAQIGALRKAPRGNLDEWFRSISAQAAAPSGNADVAQRHARIIAPELTHIISHYETMPAAEFARWVADHSLGANHILSQTAVGRAIAGQLFSRDTIPAANAARALREFTGGDPSGANLRALRERYAARHFEQAQRTNITAHERYRHHFQAYACTAIAPITGVSASRALVAACCSVTLAVRAIGSRAGIEGHIAAFVMPEGDIGGQFAVNHWVPYITHSLGDDWVQLHDVCVGARKAWDRILGWIIDDHSARDADGAAAQVGVPAPEPALAADDPFASAFGAAVSRATVNLDGGDPEADEGADEGNADV